jgi:hypothetical protein
VYLHLRLNWPGEAEHIHLRTGNILRDARDFYVSFYMTNWINDINGTYKEKAEVEIVYTC